MNIKQELDEYTSALADLNQQLKELEVEKEELKKAFILADEKGKEDIITKMDESQEKYKNLCDAIFELSLKVKKLKNQC